MESFRGLPRMIPMNEMLTVSLTRLVWQLPARVIRRTNTCFSASTLTSESMAESSVHT
ncbi:hypothetical protein DPMN_022750 [Dreissena polymorpha]|uniref:Uncharacterized protein n=1 Tax=Dreissena polymorpha TaxID=45954 RepID=A0A9D4SB12_DREPO|nr:hypothetical protein DPMN_022750 [Dreissena polymorpha]